MDGKMLARLGAVVFVAVAITATAIEMTRKETPPEMGHARVIEPAHDPLREEQRRRFLTPGTSYQPGNAQMFGNGN